MVLQIEDIIGYNPLRLADYERAIGPGENAEDPNLRTFPGHLPGLQMPSSRACSASNISFSTARSTLPRHFPRLRTPRSSTAPGKMWVYRLNISSPRAYLAHHVTPVIPRPCSTRRSSPSSTAKPKRSSTREHRLAEGRTIPPRRRRPHRCPPASPAKRASSPISATPCDRGREPVAPACWCCTTSIIRAGKCGSTASARPILRANLLFRGVEVPAGQAPGRV